MTHTPAGENDIMSHEHHGIVGTAPGRCNQQEIAAGLQPTETPPQIRMLGAHQNAAASRADLDASGGNYYYRDGG